MSSAVALKYVWRGKDKVGSVDCDLLLKSSAEFGDTNHIPSIQPIYLELRFSLHLYFCPLENISLSCLITMDYRVIHPQFFLPLEIYYTHFSIHNSLDQSEHLLSCSSWVTKHTRKKQNT